MFTNKATRRHFAVRARNRRLNLCLDWGDHWPDHQKIKTVRNRGLVIELDYHIASAYAKIRRVDDATNFEAFDEGLTPAIRRTVSSSACGKNGLKTHKHF
jgi:hypothetical protein